MSIIFWFVAAVSTTICLSRSAIFESPKKYVISIAPFRFGIDIILGELMYCSQCLGFWIGLFGFIFFPYISNLTMIEIVPNAILAGFIVSTLSITLDRIIYGRHKNTGED